MIKEILKIAANLDRMGMSKEASELDRVAAKLIIKKAGQIPAGMQHFILNTGLFGGSSYDETDWLEEEAKKIDEKKDKEKSD